MVYRSIAHTFHSRTLRDREGRTDIDMVALARLQDSVTFDKAVLTDRSVSPIAELEIAPTANVPPDLLEPQPLYRGTVQDFARELFAEVKAYLRTLWDDTPKLVWHSAGYDSRIISLALRDLKDELGDAFGTVHFRCHQPEEDLFREIMRIEGWPEDTYSVWEGPESDYYDVGRAGWVGNGFHPAEQGMNFWSDLGDDWTLITGFGGEITKFHARYPTLRPPYCANPSLARMIHCHPGREWVAMTVRDFIDAWHPLLGFDYLRLASQCHDEWATWDGQCDSIREAIIRAVCPDLMRVPYGRHAYTWNVSEARKREMLERYKAGPFFRDYGIRCLPMENQSLWTFSTVYDTVCD